MCRHCGYSLGYNVDGYYWTMEQLCQLGSYPRSAPPSASAGNSWAHNNHDEKPPETEPFKSE